MSVKKVLTTVFIFSIVFSILFSNIVYSVSENEYIKYTPENINSIYLDRVDFTYKDLNFSENELNAIIKYQRSGLDVAYYELEFLNEYILFNNKVFNVGVNSFISDSIEKVFNIELNRNLCNLYEAQSKTESGEYDVIISFIKNSKRSETLDFQPIKAYASTYIYTKDKKVDSIDELYGLKLGNYQETVFLSDEFILANNIIMTSFKDFEEGMNLLNNGEIDGILSDGNTLLIKENFIVSDISRFRADNLSNIAYKKDNESLYYLTSAISKMFTKSYEDMLIEYRKSLLEMKLGINYFFTEEELNFINSTKINPISIITLNDENLNVFKDKNGDIKGLVYDLWKRVSDYVGWDYEIEYRENNKDIDSTNYIIDLIDKNEYDVGFNVSISKTRSEKVIFLEAHKKLQHCVVGNINSSNIKSVSDIQKIEVGIVYGSDYIEFLENTYPNKLWKVYYSFDEMISAYKKGYIEYFMLDNMDEYDRLYYIDHIFDLEIKHTFSQTISNSSAVAMNENGELIKTIYNKVFSLIDKSDLVERYEYSLDVNEIIKSEKLKSNNGIITLAIIIILILTLIIDIYLFKNIKLKNISEKESKIDALTKVGNRKGLFSKYGDKIRKNYAFVFIDLDLFKDINDLYGHAVGDEALILLCKRLEKIEGLDLFRINGDEFVIVTNLLNNQKIDLIYNTIISPMKIAEKIFNLEASMGIILSTKKMTKNTSYLLSLADFAMHKAKKNENRRYEIIDKKLINEYDFDAKLESIIKGPINDAGIVLLFQPIVNIISGEVVKYEALMRMEIKGRLYSPYLILEMFIRLGKTHELDLYIFEKTVEKISKEYVNNKDIVISSNFSPETMSRLQKQDFDNILNKYKVKKENYCLEIIESVSANKKANDLIKELKNDGYSIALDDFSAGHSSLNNLLGFQVDIVKLDKSIIDAIQYQNDFSNIKKTKDYIVLESIIKMMEELGLEIIVEGAENKEIIDILRELGVKEVQGYYYSKPIPILLKKIDNCKGEF